MGKKNDLSGQIVQGGEFDQAKGELIGDSSGLEGILKHHPVDSAPSGKDAGRKNFMVGQRRLPSAETQVAEVAKDYADQ